MSVCANQPNLTSPSAVAKRLVTARALNNMTDTCCALLTCEVRLGATRFLSKLRDQVLNLFFLGSVRVQLQVHLQLIRSLFVAADAVIKQSQLPMNFGDGCVLA